MKLFHTQTNHLNTAIEIARKVSHNHQNHHCAILARGRRVISVGINEKRTHTKSNTRYRYIHAEMSALLGVSADILRNSTLYIVRVGYNHRKRIMISRPCSYCSTLILESGVRKVYYTIDERHVGFWKPQNNVEITLEWNNE